MERRIRLRDGRQLALVEHGLPDGKPLVWLPGLGGCRLWTPPDLEAARALGVRLLVLDRPGYGASELREDASLLDWPDDLAQLLDALSIARAAVAGPSGAGPYVCASALRLPDRVSMAGMIGCIAPTREGLSLRRRAILAVAARAPWAIHAALQNKSPAQIYRDMTRDAPPCDREIIDARFDAQVAMLAESLRRGVRGFAWDLHLISRPWGFSLGEIRVPVRVWQGMLDAAAPPPMGRHFARAIPNCRVSFHEREGHFLHYKNWRAILSELRAA